MQTKEPFNHDEVGSILLRELADICVIEESEVLRLNVGVMLTEASTADTFVGRDGFTLTWQEFKNIYTNYEKYPSVLDVAQAFGIPTRGVAEDTPRRTIAKIASHFRDNGKTFNGLTIPSPGNRIKFFSQKAKIQQQQDPSMDDIDPGSNNRKSKSTLIMDRLNKQDVLPGQFYANRTRIPKRRWASWLRFWDQTKHSVKPNKFKTFGRHWGKTFIMGYQIDRNLLIEIWYNSIDSTFSLHDRNGVELGSPVSTVQEAVKYLTIQVAQMDSSDEDFFTLGANNQVAQSMMRTLAQGIQGDVGEAKRQEMLKRQQRLADVSDRMQDRKDRNAKKRSDARKDKVKDLTKRAWKAGYETVGEYLKKESHKTIQKVFMTDNAPVSYAEFRERAIRAAKEKNEELGKYVQDNIRSIHKEWKDTIEAEHKRYQQQQDQERQRQKEYDDAVDRAARGALDPSNGQSDDWASALNREKEARDDAQRKQDREQFAKRHGDNIKKSLDKASKNSLTSGQAKQERDALARARADLQRGIDKGEEGEPDETTRDGNDGLGNYFGNVLDRRKKEKNLREASEEEPEQGPENVKHDEYVDPPEIDHQKMDQEAKSVKQLAQKSPYTQAMIKGNLMTTFETYDQTRIKETVGGNRVTQWFNQKFLKGRRDKLELPTNKNSYWDALVGAIKGQHTRADFIIGFSLGGKVNIEIWYVSEPSNDRSKWRLPNGTVSSFYVYDVTAQKVIRKYLPYYRNAIQVAYAKIGTTI